MREFSALGRLMLGRHSPQGELFRPDNIHLDHVGRDTIYGFLAEQRHALFRDQDFADLYRKDWGRPSVPPSQLCIALILQVKDGVSDDEAIQRSAFDLRWKVALGIDVDEKLCAKSTLQMFRAKLVLHDKYQKVFESSITSCRRAGLLTQKKLAIGIDTTPVFGRGAVKDTFNLLSDQIARVVGAVVELKDVDRDQLIAEQGLGRHFASSFKSEFDIDWDDPEQKRAVVAQLAADAHIALALAKSALRGYAADAEQTADLRSARDLLADLLLQDVDESPADGGEPCIKRGTKTDRIVSTTDPEMRHGRKSSSKTFNGYKASVAADVEEGVILATDVIAANAHDSEGAAELAAQAGKNAKQAVDDVLGDTAYGSNSTRKAITKATKGAKVIAKVPKPSKSKSVDFTVEDFKIDLERGFAKCPAGKSSAAYSQHKDTGVHRFTFSRKDCTSCPLRARCTSSKVGSRKLSVSANYNELRDLRAQQRTSSFKKAYRKRTRVEHRIGRMVQLGARRARYFGRAKVAYQMCMTAAVANLVVAMAALATALRVTTNAIRSLLTTWTDQLIAFSRATTRAREIAVGEIQIGPHCRFRTGMAPSRPDL